MDIGTRIREIRKKKRITQRKLAEVIGKEASFISHIERNSRNVSIRLLDQLAKALEVSPIEILAMGTTEFEQCIHKMVTLNEETLKKLNEYINFLSITQNPKSD